MSVQRRVARMVLAQAVAVALLGSAVGAATVIPSDPKAVRSLDGTWRFKLEQAGEEKERGNMGGKLRPIVVPEHPENFQATDYREDATWRDMAVPANWEMQGVSPATYNQPDNAIGLYRRVIEIPAEWKGRVVKVNFDGVQNGAEVYLNGRPVPVDENSENRPNFHQGGNTAFQADLTDAVKFGEKNLLAVRVYKNTKAVDLDSGDFFLLGGIHRPVTLFAVPKGHIEDFKVETKLLEGNKAELKVILTKSGDGVPSISLEGVAGTAKATDEGDGRVVFTQVLENPKLWSAEHPDLYTLNVDLKGADGQSLQRFTRKIGVREVSIKDGMLLLNGVPVKFTGMCRHEVWPDLGTALTEEAWRKDIALMKAANVNAIRTSHYPYGAKFYDLCDEMGMYVMDEMAAGWCPADDASLAPAWAQHAREMVRRDKNHPSILVWAIGNENGKGPNNKVAADEIKKLDTTRPRLVSWRDAGEANVELDDRHYTNPADVAYYNRTARAMKIPRTYLENPNDWEVRNGSDWGVTDRWAAVLDRSWKEVWEDAHVPGAFLWEWQDRAVADPSAKHLYDFDPATGINLVKVKGICDAYRNPRPWYYHVKMTYAPVKVDLTPEVSGSVVKVHATNHYSFTDLSELTTTWHLLAAGKELKAGETHLKLPARSGGDLRLDIPADAIAAADVLRLEFAHADGRNVVTYDLRLKPEGETAPAAVQAVPAGLTFPRLNLTITDIVRNEIGWKRQTRLAAALANITVQKGSGASGATAVKDEKALYAMPLGEVRSMDADLIVPEKATELFHPGMPPQPPAVTGELGALPPNAPADMSKATYAGHVRVDIVGNTFTYRVNWFRQSDTKQQPCDVQELGWVFSQPAGAEKFSWHRKGYWSYYPETHVGRITGTATPESVKGQYASKITRPDAFDFNSTKYDCDWASLVDGGGRGMVVTFTPETRHHCRAETAADGSRVLVVDGVNSPPRDISSGVVEDLYGTLHRGQQFESSFRIGAMGESEAGGGKQ